MIQTKKRTSKPRFDVAPIIEKINKIGEKFEAIYTNPAIKSDKKRNQLIQALLAEYYTLRHQIPESYYPLLTNADFNSIITTHPLFQLYKIAPNPERDRQLVESFKTNKDQLSTAGEPFFTLTPTQKFLRNFLSPTAPYRGLFIWHGTGVGKCHAPDTEIIMYDGAICKVQDIQVGDKLMGTNSQPRSVLSLGTGFDAMYRITMHPELIPVSEATTDSYMVNSEHILVLYDITTSELINMTVLEYLHLSLNERNRFRGVKSSIVWYPHSNETSSHADLLEASYQYGFNLESYQWTNLPFELRVNSIPHRTHFIAGILDSIGHIEWDRDFFFRIIKEPQLHKDIAFLVRSVGLQAVIHREALYIWGTYIYYLPLRKYDSAAHDPTNYYKIMTNTVYNYYPISIEKVTDNGQYYGFTLDGDHRYLMEDFTMTHNTCTGITIAENLKTIMDTDDKLASTIPNITILRKDEFMRQMLEMPKIKAGTPEKQCTGMTYLQAPNLQYYLKRCIDGRQDDCDALEKRVKKIIKKSYNLTNAGEWARNIRNSIEYKTKGLTPSEREAKVSKLIKETFNNTVLIVDEAHGFLIEKGKGGLTSSSKAEGETDVEKSLDELMNEASDEKSSGNDKLVSGILKIVVRYAQNMRLILMTATPMFDTARDIVSILNYLLMNDKRPRLIESEIFDNDDNLRPTGVAKLIEGARGYISYLRGNSPFDFPLRISAKRVIPDRMLDHSKYPIRDLDNNPIQDKIGILDIVACPMRGAQLKIMELYSKSPKPANDDSVPVAREMTIEEKDAIALDELAPPAEIKKIETEEDEAEALKRFEENIAIDVRSVAYRDEMQIANFVYQSIEEANNNIPLCYGNKGLNAVASKRLAGSGITFTFRDPEYGKRFLLPNLQQWSSKLAMIIENIKKAKGPVFIYSFFVDAGAIPIALALEMNGYQRYKMHGTPLLQNKYKSTEDNGDYIIYTSDARLAAHSNEYLNLRQKMVDEKRVKVFIGSGAASEGLNLFGYREVYILDPWDHINKLEQSIGRVIRQGSHRHLAPQERNVTVYFCAATMDKKESRDLAIYKRCEQKAIASGQVEKILKENAIDCELTLEDNQYTKTRFPEKVPIITSQGKKIDISLADEPFTKFCFYQKDCNYKCTSQTKKARSSGLKAIPYMTMDYSKLVDELASRMKYILLTVQNIGVADLKIKTKPASNEIFNSALLALLSMEISDLKSGITFNVVMINDIIRLIPTNLSTDAPIYRQMNPEEQEVFAIDLQHYLSKLSSYKEELQKSHEISLYDVIQDITRKLDEYRSGIDNKYLFNMDVKEKEVLELIVNKLPYSYKLTLLKKLVNKIIHSNKMQDLEVQLTPLLRRYIVPYSGIYPERGNEIYGFMIANEGDLELWKFSEDRQDFLLDMGNQKRLLENMRRKRKQMSKIYSFLIYDNRETEPKFKVVDKISKGDKESVKGMVCGNFSTELMKKYLSMMFPGSNIANLKHNTKLAQCNDIELGFMRKNYEDPNTAWYYTAEEYLIITS